MNAQELETLLGAMLIAADAEELADELGLDDADCQIENIRTFADAGLMTTHKGILVRMANGSEFQIAIQQSR